MDSRIDIFLNISLPLIAEAMKGYRLVHIVQISEQLPENYKQALYDAAEIYDFLQISVHSGSDHQGAVVENTAKELAEEISQEEVTFAWYRIDDDDLIATHFFDSMSRFVKPEFAGFVASLGEGYSGVFHKGKIWDLRHLYRPKSSVGQLYVCKLNKVTGELIQPPRADHAKIDKWAPTIIDSQVPSFLTMRHPHQDTVAGAVSNRPGIEKILMDHKNLLYADPLADFSKHFAPSRNFVFPALFVVADSSLEGAEKVSVSTVPLKFGIPKIGEFSSIDFKLIAHDAADGSRVLISIDFQEPIDFDLHWPWQSFTSTSIVAGFPLAPVLTERFILQLPFDFSSPITISIWHSRHQTSPVELAYLAVDTL